MSSNGKVKMESDVIKHFKSLNKQLTCIQKSILNLNVSLQNAQNTLEDLQDMSIVYGRFDDATIPWETAKKWLQEPKLETPVDDNISRDYDWLRSEK